VAVAGIAGVAEEEEAVVAVVVEDGGDKPRIDEKKL
jgi:hypothetical protein